MGKRFCILGGAFDPPTLGHIAVAKHVLANGFDIVWLQPCFAHRFGKEMAEPWQRLEMCELAAKDSGMQFDPINGNPGMAVTDYEIRHELPGETYHMLKKMADYDQDLRDKEKKYPGYLNLFGFKYPSDEKPHLIIGSDNALCFDKWFKAEELKQMACFVVVERKGSELPAGEQWFRQPPHVVLPPMDAPLVESSTQVRRLIREDKPTNGLISPLVADYIWEHGLYRG
jgi:nicotinate (nicotinamide) nucleotide adenylyltransferase